MAELTWVLGDPWKCAMVLEELGIPYEAEFPANVKAESYLSINPNGRVPAIVDPNANPELTLWESGAIIEYLVETYDKDHKLSYGSFPENYLTKQWLFFQVSGQGPYFGQATWFHFFHREDVPSAKERYLKEIERVCGVIDLHLKRTGSEYLVGNKCTYADLSFITWNIVATAVVGKAGWDFDPAAKLPHFDRWMKNLIERPAVKKVLADKAKAAQAHH